MTKPNNKSLSINKGTGYTDSVNPDYKLKKSQLKNRDKYVEGIKSGDRAILSQVITFIESTRDEYRRLGQDILEECMVNSGESIRIGITGVPGVGKSTFIEALGKQLIADGKKLAVLAIDPSSSRTRGSILGDKTRMPFLSTNENAFIRPSPTSGTLGGVGRKTRETMLLCEAAGYDTVFIETVGVGQSETTVHSMIDFYLLLMLAGAGDELQGIKRGVMEMADLIAINKADEDNIKAADRAKREYENALSLFSPSPSGWKPPVVTCSAITDNGISEIWTQIEDYLSLTKSNGYFVQRRKKQASRWMYETIHQELKARFFNQPAVRKKLAEYEEMVAGGKISSFKAAEKLLEIYMGE